MTPIDVYATAARPGFRINGGDNNGQIGEGSFAIGDVNGDGIPDIVTLDNNNVVYVFFGSATGFFNPFSLGSLGANLNGSNGFTITGTSVQNQIAVGDIDGDGAADIVIGGNGFTTYVFYGQKCGGTWATPCSASYAWGSVTACQGFTLNSASSSSYPTSLAVGDINGDGYADIVLSDPGAGINKGKVYVVFGQTGTHTCPGTGTVNGTNTSINVTNRTSATSPKGLIINGPSATGGFGGGGNLAIGDVSYHNNGMHDILIGDPGYNSNKGRLYVLFGQSTATTWSGVNSITAGGLVTNGANTVSANTIAAPSGFIVNDSTNEGFLTSNPAGWGIATGDVTGDGIADILIGSSDGTSRGNGKAWVIKGMSNATWQSYGTGPFTLSTMISGGEAMKFTNNAYLGSSVAIADVNHDGVGDLILGDVNWGGSDTHSGTNGSVFVIFGGASLATRNLDTSPLAGTDGFRIDCSYANNLTCGEANGVGDINGDGTQDVIIGVGQGSVTGSNDQGYFYVLYGKSSGWTSPYPLSTIQ